jgi:hypothetical protein
MASTVRVSCINNTHRIDRHERISHIGGVNRDATRWRVTEEAAIAGIEQGRWDFYVERPSGHRVRVIIATRLGPQVPQDRI